MKPCMYGCQVQEQYLSRTVVYGNLLRQHALMRENEEDSHDWRLFCLYGSSHRGEQSAQLRSGRRDILENLCNKKLN
jgi:hypothetical protein